MEPRRPGVPDPQAAVRVAHFERAMAAFNAEMGQKVAITLGKYHQKMVAPLVERIEWLELPWYRKLVVLARDWWHFQIDDAPPTPVPTPPSPPLQGEPSDGTEH